MIRVPTHLIAALVALFAATFLIAQTPTKPTAPTPAADVPQNTKELRGPNEQNAKMFLELTQGLLTLAQRLEKSDRPEDKERAKTIYAALEHAQKATIDRAK